MLARSHPQPASLHPQSFSLSRCFAPPMTCRIYFIPVPSLGFPFEAFLNPKVSYVFSHAATLLTFPDCASRNAISSSSGFCSPLDRTSYRPGFSRLR
jgi:hypothetical protein